MCYIPKGSKSNQNEYQKYGYDAIIFMITLSLHSYLTTSLFCRVPTMIILQLPRQPIVLLNMIRTNILPTALPRTKTTIIMFFHLTLTICLV